MPRKSIIMTALTACIAAAAMLATPSATASGYGHYDCSQNYQYMYQYRYNNAHITRIYNYFDMHATGAIEEGIRRIEENAGGPEANLHTIHAYYESYLSYAYSSGMYYAYDFCHWIRDCHLDYCPRLFGRNIAYCHSTCSRMSNRNAELRDQLAAALASALDDKGGEPRQMN